MREDQLPERKFRATTFAHNWGIVIPCESGYLWQQQTRGVMCTQIWIEGIFIPLNKPRTYDGTNRDLLKELEETNYAGKSTGELWKDIKEAMKFDFEEIDTPEGQPRSVEGMTWIRFTEFKPFWGHGKWVEQLIGMEVALIYPNCD